VRIAQALLSLEFSAIMITTPCDESILLVTIGYLGLNVTRQKTKPSTCNQGCRSGGSGPFSVEAEA